MAVDLVLDRGGAGHRRLGADQGGDRAERMAGDAPDRLEQGRADAALGKQSVEMLEMASSWAAMRAISREVGWRCPARRAGPHIRVAPYSPAWSTRRIGLDVGTVIALGARRATALLRSRPDGRRFPQAQP